MEHNIKINTIFYQKLIYNFFTYLKIFVLKKKKHIAMGEFGMEPKHLS